MTETDDRITTDSPAQLRRVTPTSGTGRGMLGLGFVGWSLVVWGVLVVAAWIWVYQDGGRPGDLFSQRAWDGISGLTTDLLGLNRDETPAYLDAGSWADALWLAVETLQISILATAIAGVGALATIPLAASNLAADGHSGFGRLAGNLVFILMRGLYIITRAVPELVWAMMIVFIFQAGILAGAVALAIHNFGVLGRLGAEVVEDVDPGPTRALRSTGAGNFQVMFYGILPQVLPQFTTFLLYRWEVIIRTTAVVGFVAAAGLGYQFRLDFAFFRYTDIALLLIVYILLVWIVDLVSFTLRRILR